MEKKVLIQGVKVDLTDKEEALNYVKSALNNQKSIQIVTINPEMIINSSKNKDFKKVLNETELTIPDGVGVKIALKLKGINSEQIRGIDFSSSLIELAQKNNYKIAFLGTTPEILNKAVKNIKEKYEGLNIVYVHDGFYTSEDKIIEELKEASPQILFSAVGSPKQEFLNFKVKTTLSNCVSIGVGGSFDVWAGVVEEAPPIWRKLSLEWLFRTLKQPKRFKRIFPTLPIFLFRSIIDKRH